MISTAQRHIKVAGPRCRLGQVKDDTRCLNGRRIPVLPVCVHWAEPEDSLL